MKCKDKYISLDVDAQTVLTKGKGRKTESKSSTIDQYASLPICGLKETGD